MKYWFVFLALMAVLLGSASAATLPEGEESCPEGEHTEQNCPRVLEATCNSTRKVVPGIRCYEEECLCDEGTVRDSDSGHCIECSLCKN